MFLYVFFSDFLYKSICCGYSFELHQQVDTIQMGTHSICLYKAVDKKYIGCNLKTRELLDSALIFACVVIRSNTVSIIFMPRWPKAAMGHIAFDHDVGSVYRYVCMTHS